MLCILDLSDVLLLDGEAQRALLAKGHSRVEVSCESGWNGRGATLGSLLPAISRV